MLQPADVDVFQVRVGDRVGLRGGGGAVEADHHAVQRLLANDDIAHHGLEVGELGPGIQLGVTQVGVELGHSALVALGIQRGEVAGFAILISDVGAGGDGAGNAEGELFAFQLIDADHVDAREEVAGFLNALLQPLLNGGVDGEFLGGVGDAIELRHLGGEVVEVLAGIVAHGRLLAVGFDVGVAAGGGRAGRAVGALLLGSKIPVNIVELFVIFILRTLITLPVIALMAHWLVG